MVDLLVRKLERYVRLSPAEKSALKLAAGDTVRTYAARQDIVCEGDNPTTVNVMLAGHASRYKTLKDGRRQIVAFFLPGDLCDARVFVLKAMDHSIGAISPVRLAEIPAQRFIALTDDFPRLTRALWWNTLVAEAIAREWILSVGQRSALERMAHLLCELFVRLDVVGLVRGDACELPLTQTDLAEALGISGVHANRTLQILRASGLITFRGGVLTIHDLKGLMEVGLFNGAYLHLEREGAPLDAAPA
ncbi:MAG: Crp/Fnr family transcriptional regulator [Phenylobacterium sp.]|nr:Crp/Fnr family transcriptional regulator [Phenylobacterium sp.]